MVVAAAAGAMASASHPYSGAAYRALDFWQSWFEGIYRRREEPP